MTLVIIPARMNSTRLPGKPLLKIGDRTIIERCVGQAKKAGFDPYVATDCDDIAALFPGRHVMTGDLPCGTDRVAGAAEIIDPEGNHEFVINYQGDMPFLDPEWLEEFVRNREHDDRDVTTAYCEVELVEVCRPHFRRVKTDSHIGLYGYKREALRFFARMNQSYNEIFDRLEQSRNTTSFTWGYYQFPSMPIEINTQADLDRARSCLM